MRKITVYVPDDIQRLAMQLRWEAETAHSSGALWWEVSEPRDEGERVNVGIDDDDDDDDNVTC